MARQIALQQGPLPILFLRTSLHLTTQRPKQRPSSHRRTLPNTLGIDHAPQQTSPTRKTMSIITQIHDSLHIGPHALLTFLSPLFSLLHLRLTIQAVHHRCLICAKTSSQGGLRPPQETHQLRGHLPGQDWQIEFTHMPGHRTFRYMLVCVDTFSGWVEAFPTARETANTVANTLLTHLIPRPQSSGNLEWANGILKAHLTRLTAELRLSWVNLPPAALTHIETTPHAKTGVTPFELLYGRPHLLTNLPDAPTPPLGTYLPYFTLLRSLLREHADHVLPQPVRDHTRRSRPPIWRQEIRSS